MIPVIIILIAAFIGYQRGGMNKAIAYAVLALVGYIGVSLAIAFFLIFLGPQVNDILVEVGDSV